MQSKLLGTCLIAAILFAAPAWAVTNTFDGGDDGTGTAWHTATNWSEGDVPDATEDVVIAVDCVLETDPGFANSITVNSGRTLTINAVTLELDGDNNMTDHNVLGSIRLSASGSELKFIARDHRISGGAIEGQHNNARIIDDGSSRKVTLNSGATLSGAMQVRVDFVNSGTVEADRTSTGSNTLSFTNSATVTGSGPFKATANTAVIEFAPNVTATGLTGDFEVRNGGAIEVRTDVATAGTLSDFSASGSDKPEIRVFNGSSITFNN